MQNFIIAPQQNLIKGYTAYLIPNYPQLLLTEHSNGSLDVCAYEASRELWWRTGDRMDLMPEALKSLDSAHGWSKYSDITKDQWLANLHNAVK